MIKIKKISLCIGFLISFVIFNCIFPISVKADDNKSNNILVKPVLVNSGRLANNLITTTATVTNDGEQSTFKANVEGNGKDFISFELQSFELGKGERPLAVGEMKGEVKSVNIKDTYQGDTVKISTKVNNVGNLTLPVTFNVTIKNIKGEEVFKDEKQINISRGNEENIESQWDTTNVTVGEYTTEYNIKMGNQILSDTISSKVLESYKLHIIIVSILIILFIIFVMVAKRKKNIKEED